MWLWLQHVTVCDVTLTPSPKSKNKKINRKENRNKKINENK